MNIFFRNKFFRVLELPQARNVEDLLLTVEWCFKCLEGGSEGLDAYLTTKFISQVGV